MSKSSFQYDYVLPSPIGKLGLVISGKGIQRLSYINDQVEVMLPKRGLAVATYKQINEYFQLIRTEFDLPIDIQGTQFQKRVWSRVSMIGYGDSLTYGDIAASIDSGPRAVGNACRNNPIPIIIPCHRVVKKSGMGGYCGSLVGVEIQQKDWLLRHESHDSNSDLLFSN